jgi:hypothetical protein
MKTITKAALVLLLTAVISPAFAQKKKTTKKPLFAEFPGAVDISKSMLKHMMVSKPGETVTVPFNNKFVFEGKVVSNENKYDNLQSMIIRSNNMGNTLFQLSKIINKDKSISYVGRIMNPDALEVYEIKNDVAGNYRLQRIDLDNILQDCSY